jgi:exopolysaccharide production protein ExoZ
MAATGVVVHHAYRNVDVNSAARIGAAGVDLFFVISGFIMATVATNRTPIRFLSDRIWRIFPLWWLAAIPCLIATRASWQVAFTSISLWPVYGGEFYTPILMRGWTLSFEMLFYVGFALVLSKRALIPACVFAVCFIAAFFVSVGLTNYLGSPLILEFMAGVAIARIRVNARAGAAVLVLAVAWLAVAPEGNYASLFGAIGLVRVICWGIPAAMLVYGFRALEPVFERRVFGVAVLIGDASYAIYLSHQYVVDRMAWAPAILVSLCVGVALYAFVDKPIMDARRWFVGQRLSRVAATA